MLDRHFLILWKTILQYLELLTIFQFYEKYFYIVLTRVAKIYFSIFKINKNWQGYKSQRFKWIYYFFVKALVLSH